ncbi:unnamed protein product [Phytophthora lilii]|uniref:Unnamed protein product n=1 Tax=Phytophthora lilii TaxID=2077276 RepID=A0A9W6TW21_9STRA|nr:unnamed protein product [Phytophthora lilii]
MARMLTPTNLLAALFVAGAVVSAESESYFVTPEAPDYNNKVVADLLANASSVRSSGEAYAVFDWDNTCMFGDVSATGTFYQVDNLNFRFTPEEFETTFALGYNASSSDTCFANGTNSVIGQDANGADVTWAAALADTAKDYKVLYDAYIAPTYNLTNGATANTSLSEIKQTVEFLNFRAKLGFLLYSLEVMDGGNEYSECSLTNAMIVYPRLFVGMTEDEIKSFIRASVRWNLAESLESFTYTSTGDLVVESSYSKGLRVFGGQEATMRALRAAGVDVYIISASPELFAAEAAGLLGLGYLVPRDNVYGGRFKTNDAGLFTGELQDNYPITWGPGKATVVTSILMQIHKGAAPIYASGDSDGDCEMLGTVRDGVVDTNNRLMDSSTCIHSFYEKACLYFGTTEPITNNAYLLQGQDKAIGAWITSGFTTKDGVTYESGVTSNDACAKSSEEFKTEDPDSDHVEEQQNRSRTPQKPRATRSSPDASDVLSGDFLAGAGRNVSALSKRLKQMWEALQRAPSRQQQREDGVLDAGAAEKLRLVAAELLQQKLVAHQDRNVRSLVACCLVEIMRVSSPDSPFGSGEELYRVLKLLCEQLRALAPEQTTTSSGLHSFHVLESLATAKSCLLVVGLDFTIEEDEPNMMVQLFQTLFDTITEEHSGKIENLMLSIMVACIEESDSVEQPLLDVILSPLVDAPSADEADKSGEDETVGRRTPCHMARELIRRTSELLQNPMSNFFNNILIDAPGRLGSQKSSDLKEHVYTLIFEVHKINPSLLLYVLPNVCLQLQVDEVATRSDAIALMGKLFASSRADYGHQYLKNFRDFLGRFRDASKEIRLQMIQVSVPIWEQKHDLAGLLEKEFILRLSDPEWEVRQIAVHELCDFAANRLDLISEECLRAVGERMKDKQVILRKETMTGLSQVFSTHISSYWEEDEEEDRPLSLSHRNIPADHLKKLGWIPDYVLKCYAYPQQELKLRVIQLLDDFLLPKNFSERTRANGLLFIYHSLDVTSKEAFRRILNERAKCQTACKKFVLFKVQHRLKGRAPEADVDALEKAKQELHDELSPLFSGVCSLKKLLEKLSKWKDHSVFKHIGELCDFSKNQGETRHARDQLVRSVGSKTPLGEFLKKLCRKLSLLTISQTSVAAFLDFLITKGGRPSRENRTLMDILVVASGELPDLFGPFIRDKVASLFIESKEAARSNQSGTSDDEDDEEPLLKDPRVILGGLHILANYSKHCAAIKGDKLMEDDGNIPSAALVMQLHKFCLGDSDVDAQNFNHAKESRAAELAALTIARFYGRTEEIFQLIDKLCSKEKLGSPGTSGVLPALQSLEVFAKRSSHVFSDDRPLLSRLWAHLLNDVIGEGNDPPRSSTPISKDRSQKGRKPAATKLTEARCLAIKVAVNMLVYCQPTRGSSESWIDGTKLVSLLIGVLRSGGKAWASTPTLAATFRSTASCGLIKLMRHRQLEASISIAEWHVLGFTIQDSSEDVRHNFLKKLTSHLMKQPVQYPHRYLSYLALAATDSSTSVKKTARNLLKIAVERMRRIFDAASSGEAAVINSPNRQGTDPPAMSALMVPEYALPYVIHLLAHHPKFPVKLVERTPSVVVFQSALWTDQLAYLSFFLDGLVSTNAAAADNIAFLLQILTKLSQCHDVTSPNDINIYPLIDSAVALLKKKIKKQSNLKPFPGRIFLPKHLYSPGRPSSLATPGGRKEPEAPETVGATSATREPRLSRKRSLLNKVDEMAASGGDAEEKKEDNENGPVATPPRRQSLLGNGRPEKRTYADDSSDSGAESDTFVLRSTNVPAATALSLQSAGASRAVADAIAEEKEENEVPPKKRMTSKGAAGSGEKYEMVRLNQQRNDNY